MSPHCSAIFLQHSRSADVIAAPGNTHAATGSAASISARTETPTLIASFTPISLVLTVVRGNQSRFQVVPDLASINEFVANLRMVTLSPKELRPALTQQGRLPPQKPGTHARANRTAERNQRAVPDCNERHGVVRAVKRIGCRA